MQVYKLLYMVKISSNGKWEIKENQSGPTLPDLIMFCWKNELTSWDKLIFFKTQPSLISVNVSEWSPDIWRESRPFRWGHFLLLRPDDSSPLSFIRRVTTRCVLRRKRFLRMLKYLAQNGFVVIFDLYRHVVASCANAFLYQEYLKIRRWNQIYFSIWDQKQKQSIKYYSGTSLGGHHATAMLLKWHLSAEVLLLTLLELKETRGPYNCKVHLFLTSDQCVCVSLNVSSTER